MPHERIQHGKIFVTVDPSKADPVSESAPVKEWHPGEIIADHQVLREQPSLDVFWNRDGEYVQVAIDAPTYWWKEFVKSREDDDQVISFAAFTDRLSRKEINHMIRTLRRARDAAYGSDE